MAVATFKQYIEENGVDVEVVETAGVTHTAQQAADEHGVPVSNIVKSLLVWVHINNEGKYFLILVPGDKRLDLEKWKTTLSADSIRMADAAEVKKITGYSIGGVPPFGHVGKIETYIEDGFDPNETLVAAAGSANAVFKVSLERLREVVK